MGKSLATTYLRRADQPIETVRLPGMELSLLASGDYAEVIRHVLKPGAMWALRPANGWRALEAFTVLSGMLRWQNPAGDTILGPGDTFSACPVHAECLFTAESEVVLLYFCSQPVFHAYSQEIQEMMRLAIQVEQKDGYTADHCRRLRRLSMAVGRAMGLEQGQVLALNYGAHLHDLGKVRIPDHILGKPGPLTEEEWRVMRLHPIFGREMVENSAVPRCGPIIEQHHERLDGSGYPYGLSGDRILVEAQIVAVIDTYDAMTTDRVYRKALSHEAAVAELKRLENIHYRSDVVNAFLQTLEQARAESNPSQEG